MLVLIEHTSDQFLVSFPPYLSSTLPPLLTHSLPPSDTPFLPPSLYISPCLSLPHSIPLTLTPYLSPSLHTSHPHSIPSPSLHTSHPHFIPLTLTPYLSPSLYTSHPHSIPLTLTLYTGKKLTFPYAGLLYKMWLKHDLSCFCPIYQKFQISCKLSTRG